MSRQHVDKISRPAGRKMLGDLEALHQNQTAARSIGRLRSAVRNSSASIIKLFQVDLGPSMPMTSAPVFRHTLSQAPWPQPKSATLPMGTKALSKGTICSADRVAKEARKR